MTARELALDVLLRARADRRFASDVFDERVSHAPPQERSLATQLILGTIRRAATLDALMAPFAQRPLREIEPEIRTILGLGAYQLAFLDGIPSHAAVHETVELVRWVHKPRATGFVNSVLRRIGELLTEERTDRLAADAVPTDRPGVFRKLTQPILPDPHQRPVEAIAAGFSWPLWLAERWLDQFGEDECQRLGFWFNATPPLWLRVNSLACSREEFLATLHARGFAAEPGAHPHSVRLTDGGRIAELPGYADGWFTVQDHTAMQAATVLNPQPGDRVLDLCAAPGGKTTQLAALMQNRGTIVACDIDPARLTTVATLCERLGVRIVEPQVLADGQAPPAGPFDAALVDAPCSNLGVLARRPEVRWRLDPREFEHLIRLQTRLLLAAIDRVRDGGTIVYSTCSIEPDENRGIVEAAMRSGRVTLEADETAIPGRPADGGYWARLIVGKVKPPSRPATRRLPNRHGARR